jgi:large subunit ribosomal protein L4
MAESKKPTVKKTTAAPKAAKTATKEKVQSVVPAAKKETQKQSVKVSKPTSLTTDVYGTDAAVSGSVTLPEAFFGAPVNKQLMAQAVRVYLANQREGSAHTKTRGEVDGSTRKIYKQKGTGNARHGGIRAPIFVGGGTAFGPRAHDFTLSFPKKMKQKAVQSALTVQYQQGIIRILSGFSGLAPKTKTYSELLSKVGTHKKVLVVISQEEKDMRVYMRNIKNVTILRAQDLHTYALLTARSIIITQQALTEFEGTN